MPEEPINFSQLKGKIENDNDWREGVDAYRKWTDEELKKIVQDLHEIKVMLNGLVANDEYFKKWQKRQEREETKIQGETL